MKHPGLIPILLLIASLAVPADTIVLKDGTTYEGTIVSKPDAPIYEIQVQITASIKDIKRIPKDQVQSVTRSTPDDEAFKALENILPVPDRQSLTRYDELIKGRVKPFLKEYPTSKHKLKVKKILATLEGERARVAAGDLKLDGKWIASADREANAFGIDARLAFGEMKTAADNGQLKEALQRFDGIKNDFSATPYYERAVELAGKLLRTYRQMVSANIARVDGAIAKRKSEMQRLSGLQRKATLAEIEREDAAYLALVEREKTEEKTRWLTLNMFHKGPMETVLNNIGAATAELGRIDFSEHPDAVPIYRKGWEAAAAGETAEVTEIIAKLKNAEVPARYIEKIETQLAAAEKAGLAAQKEAEEAEAARKAAEAEKRAAAPKKAAPRESEPASGGAAAEPGKSEPPAPAPAAVDDKGSKTIITVLGIVMGVVLLVALGTLLLGKKKATI